MSGYVTTKLNKETNMKLYEFSVMMRAESESDALQSLAKAMGSIAVDLNIELITRSKKPVVLFLPAIKQVDSTASHT